MLNQRHFFQGGGAIDYFVKDPGGKLYFGSQNAHLSYIFKAGQWSTIVKSLYSAYFRSPESRQLQLGGFQGLTGFPDFYYAGQASTWFKIEERFFPELELATAIPVPAVFFSGGNAWRHIDSIDLDDLEYSAGVGVRVGLSKSVLGIVNHVNLSWPLNGPRSGGLSAFVLTVTTEANF